MKSMKYQMQVSATEGENVKKKDRRFITEQRGFVHPELTEANAKH